MTTILTTSLEESTGKTAVSLALARIAADRGETVGYMKPKGTRLQSNVGKTLDEDPMLARELLDVDAEMHELEPIVYSPTFVTEAIRGREDPAELRERVAEAFEGLSADAETMLVEGGDRYTTGGIVDLDDGDVADLLDAEVLLLARYGDPTDVDEVLAAAESLGDRLAGVVFNAVPESVYDELADDVIPFLEGRGIDVLGAIPRQRDLAGVTVGDLAEELGADLLTDVPTDGYVERFSVGAMNADEALRHFRRTTDAAVITGGDRSEVQTAALEAPGVRCLILTGGYRPSGAVLGKATEKGVPVMLVQGDTLTTIDRAEDVVHSGRTRDAVAVETVQSLLAEHVDVDELLG